MAQVPPPPQADGKNIFSPPKVESKVLPASTSTFFSPLMVNVTGPDVVSFAFAQSNKLTNSSNTLAYL